MHSVDYAVARCLSVRHMPVFCQPIFALYPGNDAREIHNYYGRRIGNRTEAFDVHTPYSIVSFRMTLSDPE